MKIKKQPLSSMKKSELINEVKVLRRKIARLEKVGKMYQDLKNRDKEKTMEYEKLAALGRFTSNVAHEIRNPITVIGGIAKRMMLNTVDNDKNREYLKLLIKEARRLEDVLTDAITYSDKGIFHRRECDINQIVKNELVKFGARCKERSINAEILPGDVPQVYVDKKGVGEVIFNVIENAVDAMERGGGLLIRTDVSKMRDRDYVIVSIEDRGPGIPKEKLSIIFEPFFSTKVDHQDTGLGLPIAKKIIEAHGGMISVDSTLGVGTVVLLYFPYRARSKKNKL